MINKLISHSAVLKLMDWAYEKAVGGVTGLESAQQLAEDFMKGDEPLVDKANKLIRWQNGKAGLSGFMAGIGGLLAMPFTIPANIGSVLYIQIRMIAAIAYMAGYDLRDDRVKSLVFLCIAGNAGKDILKNIGIAWGEKVVAQALTKITQEAVVKINKAVGFKLLTKFGGKGFINLSKAVPMVGGIVGATFDIVATNAMGNFARNTFIQGKHPELLEMPDDDTTEVEEVVELSCGPEPPCNNNL